MNDHEQKQTVNHSKGLPALLPVLNPLQDRERERIKKRLSGFLKPQAVFALVCEVLRLVLFELEISHLHNCSYIS